jgi:transcriptional repressor NrdR
MRHVGTPGNVSAVRCPCCGGLEDRVVDSRAADDGTSIRRRRECEQCSTRFTTFERVGEVLPVVVKRDGRRVPFERSRIRSGVQAACKGRPVDDQAIDALVSRVEDRLSARGGEVESAQVGALALEELRRLDGVAAVRFASVYKSFQDPEDFEREIQLLVEPPEQLPS